MTPKRLSDSIQNLEDILERSRSTANYRPLDLADIGPVGPVQESSGRGAARIVRDYASPAPQRAPQRLYSGMAEAIDNDLTELKADLRVVAGTIFDLVSKSDDDHGDKVKKHLKDARHALRQLASILDDFDETKERAKDAEDEDDLEDVAEDMRHHAGKAAARIKFYKAAMGKAIASTQDDEDSGKEFDDAAEEIRSEYKKLKRRMEGKDEDSEAKEQEARDRKEAEAEKAKKSYRPPAKGRGLEDFTMSPPQTNVTSILSRAGAFGRRNAAPPTGAQAAVAKAGNSLAAIKERILGSSCTMESSLRAQRIAQMLENGANAEADELLKSSTADVKNLFH